MWKWRRSGFSQGKSLMKNVLQHLTKSCTCSTSAMYYLAVFLCAIQVSLLQECSKVKNYLLWPLSLYNKNNTWLLCYCRKFLWSQCSCPTIVIWEDILAKFAIGRKIVSAGKNIMTIFSHSNDTVTRKFLGQAEYSKQN